MAARTVSDQVSALLSQSVSGPRDPGAQSSGLNASAIFGSIALTFLLKPRTALYLAHLARNGLMKAVQAELSQVTALQSDISDLGNFSTKLGGADVLATARSALLQMENLPRLPSGNGSVQVFERAVQEFLTRHISRNVRKKGASQLTRPASEALRDLPSDLAALKDLHTETLSRLYTLAVGIENFTASPFSAMLGTSAVARARADLEDILAHLDAGGDPAASRDIAVRLIAARAAVSTITSPPALFDPPVPAGTQVESSPETVSILSQQGPFDLGASPVFSIDNIAFTFFVPASAFLISDPIQFPMSAPGQVVFSTDLSDPTLVQLAGPYATVLDLVTDFNFRAPSTVRAASYAGTSNRVLFYAPGSESLRVEPGGAFFSLGTTTGTKKYFQSTGASVLGLTVGKTGSQKVSARDAADALGLLFPTFSFTATSDDRVLIEGPETAPGTVVTVSAPDSFGITGQHRALTKTLVLLELAPGDVLQVGDTVRLGSKKADGILVQDVDLPTVYLERAVESFTGPLYASSALTQCYDALFPALNRFLKSWRKTQFATDLAVLDRLFASLMASQTQAQRGEARKALSSLASHLTTLLNLLGDPSTMLPPGAADEERRIVDGILLTLAEKNYDRATDLLLRCDLQALLELDEDMASYAGTFLKATSAVAVSALPSTVQDSAGASISAGEVWDGQV